MRRSEQRPDLLAIEGAEAATRVFKKAWSSFT